MVFYQNTPYNCAEDLSGFVWKVGIHHFSFHAERSSVSTTLLMSTNVLKFSNSEITIDTLIVLFINVGAVLFCLCTLLLMHLLVLM